MEMREQAEDRLRECEEKRKNIESKRNAHQDNFPDDGRPFNERLEEHQKKLEELNNGTGSCQSHGAKSPAREHGKSKGNEPGPGRRPHGTTEMGGGTT